MLSKFVNKFLCNPLEQPETWVIELNPPLRIFGQVRGVKLMLMRNFRGGDLLKNKQLHIFFSFTIGIVILFGGGGGCTTSINSTPLWTPTMPDSLATQSPKIDPHQLELTIHHNTNNARQLRGLRDLNWSDDISQIARSHSDDMALNAYFSHINKKGESASERATRFGFSGIHANNKYAVVGIGENLFATHIYEEYVITEDSLNQVHYSVKWKSAELIAQEAVEAWLNSIPHRNNLLSTAYSSQGIGVSIGSNGTIFVTQNFN